MSLVPIRPHVRATLTAPLAAHSRAKRRHEHVIPKVIHVDDRLVAAIHIRAINEYRPHAVGAHIAESHRCRNILHESPEILLRIRFDMSRSLPTCEIDRKTSVTPPIQVWGTQRGLEARSHSSQAPPFTLARHLRGGGLFMLRVCRVGPGVMANRTSASNEGVRSGCAFARFERYPFRAQLPQKLQSRQLKG